MFKKLAVVLVASQALAAYVPGKDNFSTFTPSGAAPSGASTDYTQKFGIQINTLSNATASSTASKAKRAGVAQITDGQVQAQSTLSLAKPSTKAPIQQINDGQIQHQTTATAKAPEATTASTKAPVQQINDGQIQHQTTASAKAPANTKAPIQQINDGQIQHQTTATAKAPANTKAPVQQINDGQIQHQTTATAAPVQQINDGQIQHQTTASVADQINDGQIQHHTTASGAAQISDGQVQASGAAKPTGGSSVPQSCASDNALSMTLKKGILTDSKGRIGAIVANRQFQFDGPPPQAGSIYAAGWSVTKDGNLAIGDKDTFYQCKSGDFYNLYDENVAAQCEPVTLSIVDLVQC